MKTTMRVVIGLGAAVALVSGLCAAAGHAGDKAKRGSKPKKAEAVIEPKSDSKLSGKATFKETNGKVTLTLKISGAEPGTHAVHLHETGDCSAADATSAGGHWNPTHEDHGKWGSSPYHHGDIGNLEVNSGGTGVLTFTTDLWSIGGSPETDIVGKSVIVHAKADDFKTQPTGNAGGRFGCGVIKLIAK